ncbi:mycothiol acetyltransferase [Oxobacter pfennigii]|uniref:Mycothiol acetyltransferase n=1 Tax=Oxobacter pfennigii TaxID=36849 RepID=A0A0P8W4I6_9CLOT|nr:GNAT family N-acetyltransferase [Oxobacter pfennigii]KPU43494.1 mycothiol acetyltransferase [Oxobacter pfennigii]
MIFIIKSIHEPWIKLKESLNSKDYDLINALQEQCIHKEQITLKLELDYKLGDALNRTNKITVHDINEFMYFNGKQLIGYIGICGFGGAEAPLEITGMAHPEYRRLGIFSKLYELVMAECKRRESGSLLALCDNKSVSGQKFLERIGAVYKYSEFEMHLHDEPCESIKERLCDISFRKATNTDAYEVARQNAIYFGGSMEQEDKDIPKEEILLPEDEERRGMTIYLAEKDKKIIGKVHLQVLKEIGGIYGLGVLPDKRGKGFGRAILLKAIEKLKDVKVKEIMLQVAAENATALGLYKSCGFQETSVMDYFELK